MPAEKLRQRLAQIQARLSQAESRRFSLNEAETERLVIEPILDALGYDPLDFCKRTLSVGADFPDYMVLPESERRWCLEAKQWDAALTERFERQAVNYANNNGAQWAVLTNGNSWRVYNTRAAGSLRDMLAYEVDTILKPEEAADILVRLSRESMEGGELEREYRAREVRACLLGLLRAGNRKIMSVIQRTVAEQLDRNITIQDVQESLNALLDSPPGTERLAQSTIAPVAESASNGSRNLNALAADGRLIAGSKPSAVTLPNGLEEDITSWRELAQAIVKWLLSNDLLTEVPFDRSSKAKNYFLNRHPVHKDGRPMITYTRFESSFGEVFVDVHRSAHNMVSQLVRLCTALAVSPEEIKVCLLTPGDSAAGTDAATTRKHPNKKDQSARAASQPVAFNDACAARAETYLGKPLVKRSRAVFVSADGSHSLVCLASAESMTNNLPFYWFGFRRTQQTALEQKPSSYIALGCGSDKRILLIPYSDLSRWLSGLNTTERNGAFYWHIQIVRDGERYTLHGRRGFSPVDLSGYAIPIDR